jgi:hypothetical protein
VCIYIYIYIYISVGVGVGVCVCEGRVGSRHCQPDEFHPAKRFAVTNRFFALYFFLSFPFSVNVYYYFGLILEVIERCKEIYLKIY